LYITGFVFVGGQGASFYGPSLQITLSGARKNNASTSGLTEFFSATSSLPSTQSQYYGTTP
jgi:hypothetical protein